MVTRGVASVRSPVRNLCWFNPEVSHGAFVEAVVQVFREEYGVIDEVKEVDESEDLLDIPYIREGMAELTVRGMTAMPALHELMQYRLGTGRLDRRQNSRTRCKSHSHGVKWYACPSGPPLRQGTDAAPNRLLSYGQNTALS